jgi:hypothetical protein
MVEFTKFIGLCVIATIAKPDRHHAAGLTIIAARDRATSITGGEAPAIVTAACRIASHDDMCIRLDNRLTP